VHGSAGKRPGVGEMIFAGVEAERNTNDAIWIRIRPSAPVSLAASVPPDPEAAEAAGSGSDSFWSACFSPAAGLGINAAIENYSVSPNS